MPETSTRIGTPPAGGGCYRLDEQGRRVRVKAPTPNPGPMREVKGETIPEMAKPGFRQRGRQKVQGTEVKKSGEGTSK